MTTRSSSKRSFKRDLSLSIAAVGLSLGGAVWMLMDHPQSGQPESVAQTAPAADTAMTPKKVASAPASDGHNAGEPSEQPDTITASTPRRLEQPFASSLEGTEIDGALTADGNGELVVNLEVRDFFDYFLNTVGEVPPEEAIAQMHQLIESSLPPQAVNQAMDLLGRYLTFKQDALDLQQQPLDPARKRDPAYQVSRLKDAMTQLQQLRRQHFSAGEQDAFFGLEEAYASYTVKSLEIQQREDLSAEQKRSLIAYQREQLPDEIRQTEQRLYEAQDRQQAIQQAIESASTPEHAAAELRELGVPDEQITEVETYLRERQQFEDTYRQYQVARERLEESGLAEEDLASRRQDLLKRYFESEKTQTWARLRDLTNS